MNIHFGKQTGFQDLKSCLVSLRSSLTLLKIIRGEALADQILNEVDCAENPYSSFETLCLLTPGWDFHEDLSQVMDHTKGEPAGKALVESLDVPSSLESMINETILNMKSD